MNKRIIFMKNVPPSSLPTGRLEVKVGTMALEDVAARLADEQVIAADTQMLWVAKTLGVEAELAEIGVLKVGDEVYMPSQPDLTEFVVFEILARWY